LHEARDRILLLKQRLQEARQQELPTYVPFLDEQVCLLEETLEQAKIPEHYRVAVVGGSRWVSRRLLTSSLESG
jgi:hypothetical protein